VSYAEHELKPPISHSNPCSRFSLLAASLLLLLILASPASLTADDGSVAANPAGGLEWKREPRVSMEKERLTISLAKITVEFEFLNDSDQDVTAQVGFPIPPYAFEYRRPMGYHWHESSPDRQFGDFAVWVDGQPVKYQTEERAFLKGVEHTEILNKFGIDIETFGGKNDNSLDLSEPDDQITRLPNEHEEQLLKLGLIEGIEPKWTVRKMHHWTQTFPAHRIVRIRHEYAPVAGYDYFFAESFRELEDICVEDSLYERVKARAGQNRDWCGSRNWIKYILTSANTWKTPIKDFELIVDKSGADYVSFCWDGKVEKLDANRVVARAKDFVPTKELTIYFLHGVDVD
jgi:hypothetical protein